jgi:two-component system, cell cycle sensor histidine kinase and response regulator CckA
MRLSGKDGAQVSAWMEATVAAGDGGTSVCRVAISDISERNAIQEKLRRSQRLLETAGAMAQLGGWSVGLPGNEMTLTDETRAVLDFPKDSAPSLADVLALCDDGSRQSMATALQTCARHGTAFDKELELVSALGRRIVARVIGQAVRDSEGGIMGVEGALQDITVRREAEQARVFLESQLRESQKMEAIGTLAAGIANDFNNIVGIVLGNAELARREVGAQSRAIVSLDEIRKAGNRARDLVEQILSFSRQRPPSSRVLALASVVEDSVSLLRKALPAGVRIECHCAADVPSVVADPTQLQQVLLNLGNNAIEAMEGRSGSIDIDLSGLTLDERSARFDLNLRPGRYARIVVRDTGRGMDEATRQRIFEPFFTTKPIGQGTGLGLSVVHGIVQAHDGAIVVRSEPGSGSRFELYFPHAAAGTTPMAAEQGVGASEEGRGRNILCIDDDESQIFLIRRTLERSGYRVSACLDQREALDLLRSSPRPFDLVVTDFNMPGMNGLDLARAILKTHPALPVVVLTGYITDTLRAQAAEAGIAELISKPQETALLLRALQRLLPPASTVPLAGP